MSHTQIMSESRHKVNIRNYTNTDFEVLERWWLRHDEPAPLQSMVPTESTWILELDGIPALSVSLILTNIQEYCYAENFIGNPDLAGPERQAATCHLLEYIEQFALSKGYRRLLCFGYRPKIMKLYQELGFAPTLAGVTAFAKPLKE